MSLYSSMRTSISGMHAQSNRLGVVSDNVANASTVGYKRGQALFSTLVMPQLQNGYHSGYVDTNVRHTITQQGAITGTKSTTDLAIQGAGFFLVADAVGTQYLTRAGAFEFFTRTVENVQRTHLVNTAGFSLLGQKVTDGVAAGPLVPVTFDAASLYSEPTTRGRLAANFDADAAEIDSYVFGSPPTVMNPTPRNNQPDSAYTTKSTIIAYNGAGGAELLDVYYTRHLNDRWEVSIFNQAEASSGGFPYTGGPLATGEIEFDPATGTALAPLSLAVPIPNGAVMDLDLGGTTQKAAAFVVTNAWVNGSAASAATSYEISEDGFVMAVLSNGSTSAQYRLQLATVMSPDRLSVLDGNVFLANGETGDLVYGYPNDDMFGKIRSGGLEESNVDIADELTEMIEAQRVYTSNSKVFQTGDDMWEVLTNMKR